MDKTKTATKDGLDGLDAVKDRAEILGNPEVVRNYENVINWLLSLNTIVIIFILGKYDIYTPVFEDGASSLQIAFILGMSLLISSTLGLFMARIMIFLIMNEHLLTPKTDAKIKLRIMLELNVVNTYISYPIGASALGLTLIFLFLSFNLAPKFCIIASLFCGGFF